MINLLAELDATLTATSAAAGRDLCPLAELEALSKQGPEWRS